MFNFRQVEAIEAPNLKNGNGMESMVRIKKVFKEGLVRLASHNLLPLSKA